MESTRNSLLNEIDVNRLNKLCLKAVTDSGPRYTEASHVELRIADLFDGLCRTELFKDVLLEIKGNLVRSFIRVNSPAYFSKSDVLKEELNRLSNEVTAATLSIEKFPFDYNSDVSESCLSLVANNLNELTQNFRNKLYSYEPEKKSQPTSGFRNPKDEYLHDFHEFLNIVSDLSSFTEGRRFQLYNKPFLWITSRAGFGKTHLLCDVVKKRVKAQLPTLLLLGQQISNLDIWVQLCRLVNIEDGGNPMSAFIEATRRLSEQKNSKFLLVIDALNEGPGLTFWPEKINEFQKILSQESHISLAVSSRSTYDHLIKPSPEWLVVEHRGFEQNIFQATSSYFRHYKITSHEIPLVGEFRNPLFLKTYCEALQGESLTTIARGHKGIKWIHEQYFYKIDLKLKKN